MKKLFGLAIVTDTNVRPNTFILTNDIACAADNKPQTVIGFMQEHNRR